jgi:hypothetical protein
MDEHEIISDIPNSPDMMIAPFGAVNSPFDHWLAESIVGPLQHRAWRNECEQEDGFAPLQSSAHPQAPDLVAVEEIQDNSGATDDGVVTADQTLGELAIANHVNSKGGDDPPNVNSEFTNQMSDHQPQVVRIPLP